MKLTVDYINKRATEGVSLFIKESEKRYYDEIYSVAREIISDSDKKIIMIAGPSGSGKTTTAHILKDYLINNGKKTEVVSLDDFYLDFEEAPLDEEGEPDFETVHSLDIAEINRCFKEIIENGSSLVPIFDFGVKKRKTIRKNINIKNDGILVVEGLHALNPLLFEHLPTKNIFKIYISVTRTIYDAQGETLLSSRQMRLVRRMSRDAIYRNASAQQTFDMWENVIAGESKHLYKFKPTADRCLTTLHEYEPCVFKNRVIELLSQINPLSEDYDYVLSTINGLKKFVSIEESLVPEESLIREFIKGGKYE